MPAVRVKICGLTTPEAARATVRAGADYIGINLFAPSARSVAPDVGLDIAAASTGAVRVALMVDPDDDLINRVIDPVYDMLQLHGQEPPDRVAEIKARTGKPVMKVIPVREVADLDTIPAYAAIADQLMIDAKAPKGSAIPGGHGVPFDWTLLQGRRWALPWMLAGGLTAQNVAQAIRLTGATQVDVASGVESAPGIKDQGKVRAFVAAATG